MAKKNLPNIPLYIGDWQKDLAAVSMQGQGAWLQIIFKLWTNGKQNVYKTSTKRLQNLWKCSDTEMKDIIDELIEENVGKITIEGDYVEFTCRRFVKENKLSAIRRKARGGNKDESKQNQNSNKPSTKEPQNPENENDFDNENENKDEDLLKKSEKTFEQLSESVEKFMNQFSIPDAQTPRIQKVIGAIQHKGLLEKFETQTSAYFELKKIDGTQVHTWTNYIGSAQEDFLDGHWLLVDSVEKLSSAIHTGSNVVNWDQLKASAS